MFKYFNKIKNILQTPIVAIFKNSYFYRYMCQHCLLVEGKDYKKYTLNTLIQQKNSMAVI